MQSSAMALMAAKGEIGPMPDAAIFADTQAEPAGVYKWLDWLEKQLPFPVYRVTHGSLTEQITTVQKNKAGGMLLRNSIPLQIKNGDGSAGKLVRDCTADFKIKPLIKKQKELAGIKRGEKQVKVTTWIGISLDEVVRMKPSREKWCQHIWPLVDMRMTRHDCKRWMEKMGSPNPRARRVSIVRFTRTMNGVVSRTMNRRRSRRLCVSSRPCKTCTSWTCPGESREPPT